MFANTFQKGFISVFYSVGTNPLQLWDKQVKNGHIRRVVDDEVRSLVLEISGTNVATTYITCPIKPRASLGIKLPFLVMIIKNMKKYFTFEIQILDDKDMHRRFRVSNFQSTTKVQPFCTTMPIGLSSGWNQVQFNLADFTRRAYGSAYLETTRVQIHANVRIRRIYFSDVLYSDDKLPNEYKLFLPTSTAETAKSKPMPKRESKIGKKASKKMSAGEKLDQEIPSGALPTPVMPLEEPTVVSESEKHLLEDVTVKEIFEKPDSTNVSEFLVEEQELFSEALDTVEEKLETFGEENRPTGDMPAEQADLVPIAPNKSGAETAETLDSESTDAPTESEIETA